MRFLIVLLVAGGCGAGDVGAVDGPPAAPDAASSDAGPPDAPATPDASARPDAGEPPADAPPSATLEELDFRALRGDDLPTTTAFLPTEELFALGDDGFVFRDLCLDSPGCAYTWHDDAGAVRKRREHLLPLTATTVSPDGRRALLMAADDVGTCDRGTDRFTVARGTLQLLDLATGASTLDLALRMNPWSATGFTPDSRWFFAAPLDDGVCLPPRLSYRSVTAPFAEPPGLEGTFDFVQALDAERWLAFRGSELGVVDPDAAGSFVPVTDSPTQIDVTGGWTHTYEGVDGLVFEIVSVSPAGEVRRTPVERDEDWFPFGAAGRWVRVCGFRHLPGSRVCRVIDVLGESGPATFTVVDAEDHHEDAVLLGDGAIVFFAPVADDRRAVQRLDFAGGRLETLHDGGAGDLRPLGDGAAALFHQKNDAWLIEAGHEQRLADQVDFVLTAPRTPFFPLVRQHDLAVLVSTSDDVAFSLRVVDVKSRRLATLSDRLHFTLPPGADPFAFGDCSMPWVTQHATGIGEGLVEDARHLFFVEEPAGADEPAALWIVPIDLSAPPRRLATLPDPESCRPPLTSPSGRRLGFLEVDPPSGGVKVTIGTE